MIVLSFVGEGGEIMVAGGGGSRRVGGSEEGLSRSMLVQVVSAEKNGRL